MTAPAEYWVCNRCDYHVPLAGEGYCPKCRSCGECLCCPCNKPGCEWCTDAEASEDQP